MWKALALKELRETFWIAGIAAIVLAYYLIYHTGYDILSMQASPIGGMVPFHNDWFLNGGRFAMVAVILALAIGFRQSAWESVRGTYLFLVYRPISREQLFAVKLGVGLGLHLAVTGAAILFYAFWAALPGTHASPFFWSMTDNEWMLWISTSALYFGAFLCGIREARWYGTRLFPLAAVAVVAIMANELPLPWLARLALILVVDVLYVAVIFHVVRNRDYP
jgi:hypothetical protein